MRLILCSAGSFVFGALLVGVLAYAAAVRSLHHSLAVSYDEQGAQAQLETLQLRSLRSGDVARVIAQLERGLDANTLQLANYEEAVPAPGRQDYVYAVLADVRDYREQHPSDMQLPLQRALLQKAFSLRAPRQGLRQP
jgi:hypothetical protein